MLLLTPTCAWLDRSCLHGLIYDKVTQEFTTIYSLSPATSVFLVLGPAHCYPAIASHVGLTVSLLLHHLSARLAYDSVSSLSLSVLALFLPFNDGFCKPAGSSSSGWLGGGHGKGLHQSAITSCFLLNFINALNWIFIQAAESICRAFHQQYINKNGSE